MSALINLFICVLKNTRSPSVLSDLSLLDMAAGHFARMELVTSQEVSFPFGREVASLARQVAASAQGALSLSEATLAEPVGDDFSSLGFDIYEDVSCPCFACKLLAR